MKPEENHSVCFKMALPQPSPKCPSWVGGADGAQERQRHSSGNGAIVGVIRIIWGVTPAGRCPKGPGSAVRSRDLATQFPHFTWGLSGFHGAACLASSPSSFSLKDLKNINQE